MWSVIVRPTRHSVLCEPHSPKRSTSLQVPRISMAAESSRAPSRLWFDLLVLWLRLWLSPPWFRPNPGTFHPTRHYKLSQEVSDLLRRDGAAHLFWEPGDRWCR